MSVDEAFRRLMQSDAARGLQLAEVPPPAMESETPTEDDELPQVPMDEAEPGPELLDPARFTRVPRLAHHPVDPRSQIAEEYRILRTRLQALSLPKPSILFTSCHHNEGKTSTALNLALTLAKRRGSKILLVDFDLRRPRLHKMLGLPQREVDIVSVLRGKCDPEDAIFYSEEDNLHVMAAKREYTSGTDLLEAARTRELLDRLHASFDFVLVDSCPCLSTSDPAILGPYVGGTVIVIRSLQTQRESIEHAISSLNELGIEVIGVVLTFMRYFIPRYLYRYQYYHGYYYYRGYGGAYGADMTDSASAVDTDEGMDALPKEEEPVLDEPNVV